MDAASRCATSKCGAGTPTCASTMPGCASAIPKPGGAILRRARQADPPPLTFYVVLLFAALWAGAQNALAGGGSFITLAALLYSGIDSRAANITSTVALFPGQLASGWLGRELV